MVRYTHLPKSFFTLFALLITLTACQEDEPFLIEPDEVAYPGVDQQLWPLFEAFEKEGALRGFDIDLKSEGITGEIKNIPEQHVAGLCTYGQFNPGAITIDREFWSNSSGNFQEFIVFHELGHCYLGRGHREDADDSGFCISIMRSGVDDCRDNYHYLTREEYLDELFFPGDF